MYGAAWMAQDARSDADGRSWRLHMNVRPAMQLKVPFRSMESLADTLNELDGYPLSSRLTARPVLPKQSTVPIANPWRPVLEIFSVLSPSVRAEEAQRRRDTAQPAHPFMSVRALRFGEHTIIPERPPTSSRAAEAA